MKFSHTEEKRDGRHLDILTDETPPLPVKKGERIEVRGSKTIGMKRANPHPWEGRGA
jgi:hypothetical protein